MASPFGGHPTLAHYIAWIADNGGHAQSGFSRAKSGSTQALTKIESANGGAVVIVGVAHGDRLEPTYVAYLDRRLGVRSPWFTVPE